MSSAPARDDRRPPAARARLGALEAAAADERTGRAGRVPGAAGLLRVADGGFAGDREAARGRVVEAARPPRADLPYADGLARGEDLAARPRRSVAARRGRLDRDVAPVQHLPDVRRGDRRRARPDDQAAPLAAPPHGAVPVRPGSARRPDDLELARARRMGTRRGGDGAQPRPLHDRPRRWPLR